MRTFASVAVAGAIVSFVAAASPAAAAGTTRIETRPFYGAVVTIEEGVRVFRPLPPTERVIVNPHGQTPLSLGFNETYVTERNYNYNYNETSGGEGASGAPVGFYGGYGYGRHHGRRHHGGGGGRGVVRRRSGHGHGKH